MKAKKNLARSWW